MKKEEFRLKLRGKTAVFIDWANVHGWEKSLKREVDPRKLFKHLQSYPEIKNISLYFGTDEHKRSKQFLTKAFKIGFRVITKPVKYIRVTEIEKQKIYRRKCDFDMEIALDCFECLDQFDSFIFFSGDGDFATLYGRLVVRKKQVIVVYSPGHLGKEIWQMRKGIFKTELERLGF